MTRKRLIVIHQFGWVCSSCGIIQWYETKTIRNASIDDHVLESPECKKVIAKTDKQDVSPRNGHP